jgi:hypothetical protein
MSQTFHALGPRRLPACVCSPRKTFISVIIAGTIAPGLWACDYCAVYSALEARGEGGPGFLGGISEQFTRFDTFQSDGHDAPNPDGEYLNSLISQVYLAYHFSGRAGVQLNLPIIYRSYGKTGVSASVSGIGDASLLGNYRLYGHSTVDATCRWTVLGGVKFPTGDPELLNPADPEFAAGIGGHDLALGSGSFDGLVGTDLFARWKRLFATAALQYGIRSEGDFSYRFANDLSWNGGPGVYLLLQDERTLSLQVAVSGETKGQDTVEGVATDDTAVTSVFLGPELNATWGENVSAALGAALPVYIHSSGDQIVPGYRVRATITLRF